MDIDADQISQLGLGGVLLTLWTRMLFDFLKDRRDRNEKCDPEENRYKMLQDARIETAIQKLAETSVRQTEILESIRDEQKDLGQGMERLSQKLDTLRPCKQVGR